MSRVRVLAASVVAGSLLSGCGQAGLPQPTPSPSQSAGPPVADADYLETGFVLGDGLDLTELGLTEVPLEDQGTIIGAHYGITVDQAATAEELTEEQLSALSLSTLALRDGHDRLLAGPGREFLLTALVTPDEAPRLRESEVKAVVLADGAPRPLLHGFGGESVIVVSVPAGEDAVLEVTSAGATSAVNLRTGQKVSGEIEPADLLQRGKVEVVDYFRTPGLTPAQEVEGIAISVTVDPASHIPGPGRPEPGNVWLRLTVTATIQRCESCPDDDGTYTVDLGRSLTIRGDGVELAIPDSATLELTRDRLFPKLWTGTWEKSQLEAPADVDSYEVVLETTGSFADDDTTRQLERQFRGQENAGVLSIKPSD